jgi:hypothetical protein
MSQSRFQWEDSGGSDSDPRAEDEIRAERDDHLLRVKVIIRKLRTPDGLQALADRIDTYSSLRAKTIIRKTSEEKRVSL